MDLAGFGDDGPDDECTQRHAVAKLGRQQRDAKAEPEHGDQQHLVALEAGDVADQTRYGDQSGHQGHDQENGQFAEGRSHGGHAPGAGHRDA